SCDTHEDKAMDSPLLNISMPPSHERMGTVLAPLGLLADSQGPTFPLKSSVSALDEPLKHEVTFLLKIDDEAPSHGDFGCRQD
ncbi:hypothetical protein PIB30_110331, partial [Stylosanthes scabra]|nr:hypothetical protein [Stylosanthes scabra]